MSCETCVVSLTLLVGMGLLDLATPPESRETQGQVGHVLCALITPPPPLPAREIGLCASCGFVFLVQLCFQFQD